MKHHKKTKKLKKIVEAVKEETPQPVAEVKQDIARQQLIHMWKVYTCRKDFGQAEMIRKKLTNL